MVLPIAPALMFSYSNTLSSLTAGFGGNPYNGYVGVNFALSTWINLTATIIGNNVSAYKNGILVGGATNSPVVPTPYCIWEDIIIITANTQIQS